VGKTQLVQDSKKKKKTITGWDTWGTDQRLPAWNLAAGKKQQDKRQREGGVRGPGGGIDIRIRKEMGIYIDRCKMTIRFTVVADVGGGNDKGKKREKVPRVQTGKKRGERGAKVISEGNQGIFG